MRFPRRHARVSQTTTGDNHTRHCAGAVVVFLLGLMGIMLYIFNLMFSPKNKGAVLLTHS